MGLFKRKKKDKDLLMIPMEFQAYADCCTPAAPPAELDYVLQYEMKDLYKNVILTGLGHLVAVDEVVYAANKVLDDYAARFGTQPIDLEKFWNSQGKEENTSATGQVILVDPKTLEPLE